MGRVWEVFIALVLIFSLDADTFLFIASDCDFEILIYHNLHRNPSIAE